MLGVESLVLKTGRRNSAVVTRGVESLRLAGRDAAQAGRTNCVVVSSGPGGWLLKQEIFSSDHARGYWPLSSRS